MKRYFTLVTFFFVTTFTTAQQIGFPGAEGFGKNTTGGRGSVAVPTTVFEVTNLSDVNTVGSLRYALSATATYRTIVFRISGTIHLNSSLSIKSNTTIAGQSAPGDGICIADYPVTLGGNNIIVRYIRFRMGDKNQLITSPAGCGVPVAPFTAACAPVNGSGGDDAFGGTGYKNILIDHCTMSWSNDEACTIYRGDSTTIQWCILSEPLNYSYHFETGDTDFEHHGYGGIWGGQRSTFHHNLFAHCQGRLPRFDGSRNLGNGATVGLENVDFRNNVIYNWGSYNTNGGEGGNYNIVNNYYKYGPSTSTSSSSGVSIKTMLINPYKQTSPALPYGKYFLDGNIADGSTTVSANNWKGAAMSGGSYADTISAKVTTPFNFEMVNTQTATDAYNVVLSKVGCLLPFRDTLDQRIINDVKNRTGKLIDVQGGYPHATPYAQTTNAWPTLISTSAPIDIDHDGMPDEWESQRGLNFNNSADRNLLNANGFTNLENYLNGDSIVAFGTNNTCISSRKIILSASNNWMHATDTSYRKLISTDTLNAIASILDNSAQGEINVSYFVTNTNRFDANNKVYLNRNINITPTNTLASPVSVRFYFSISEFNALKATDNSILTLADLRVMRTSGNTCLSGIPATGTGEVISPVSTGTFGTYQNGYYVEFTTQNTGNFYITGKDNIVTATTNLTIDDKIFVTPNPAKQKINIVSSLNQNVNLKIIDITGKIVLPNYILSKGINLINISQLSNGIYYILMYEKSKVVIKKFIKS